MKFDAIIARKWSLDCCVKKMDLLLKQIFRHNKTKYATRIFKAKAIVKLRLRLEHGNFTLKCLIPIGIKKMKISCAQRWPSYFPRKMEMLKAKCRIFLKDGNEEDNLHWCIFWRGDQRWSWELLLNDLSDHIRVSNPFVITTVKHRHLTLWTDLQKPERAITVG